MRKLRLGVLVSGRGTNLQAIIDRCRNRDIPACVEIVISNRPRAQALQRAADSKIKGVCVRLKDYRSLPDARSAYDQEIVKILREHRVDLVVLAGYDKLVGPDIMNAFPMRVINIHPALLPSFVGLNAQQKALEYGVKVTGASVFFVDSSVDGGPIIAQEAVPVLEDDNVESLSGRILEAEHRILPLAIKLIAQDRVRVCGRVVRILPDGSKDHNV